MVNKCVFSGKAENLNNSFKVKLENGSIVECWVSDEFIEEATVKTVREAYIKQKSETDAERKTLEEMAARLGLKLVDSSTVIPEPQQSKILRPQQSSQPQTILEGAKSDKRIIDGRLADVPINLNVTGTAEGAPAPTPAYAIRSDTKSSTDLKEGEKAEIGLVKGRQGMDVAIPIKREGKMGTTRVSIVDSGGDKRLQQRFKDLAAAGQNSDVGKEYAVKYFKCPACNGSGVSFKQTCKKCNGVGEIIAETMK